MQKQHFIFKIKSNYLPKFINDYIKSGVIDYTISWLDIFNIDQKYFRKIKIQSIEKRISNDDKQLLDYLTNDNFTHLISQEEVDIKVRDYSSNRSGPKGAQGPPGNYYVPPKKFNAGLL
jgi:hypothetical protein